MPVKQNNAISIFEMHLQYIFKENGPTIADEMPSFFL